MSTNHGDDPDVNGIWRQAAEVNRRIDEAVEAFERQIRGGAQTVPTRPPPQLRRTTRDAPTPLNLRPPSDRPPVAGLHGTLTVLPSRAAPRFPAPRPRVDLDTVDAQLRAELDALEAKRAECRAPEALAFSVPWSAMPRPLFIADSDGRLVPNPVSDEEIRDIVQPHWRAVHEQANAADSALIESRDAFERAGLFRRLSGARRALTAAQEDWDEATLAKETLDLLWQGESMRRQFEHFRTMADESFKQAMATTGQDDEVTARIVEIERQKAIVAALRAGGVTALEPDPKQTRAQALETALIRLAPPQPADSKSDYPPHSEPVHAVDGDTSAVDSHKPTAKPMKTEPAVQG
ncbi:hypothetical protein [Azospirillum soli]|uniref:hypothetical protein n=1 Tax=Azospirillum soli TaxID=1304799 RepID=UPI001AEB8EC5|nr:hypothetical protein [Azospirillum soli]MBP2315835.1 hypothetical protein [Azospirillum soli]